MEVVATVVAGVAALVAIWSAASAQRSAKHAARQAAASELQATEVRRQGDLLQSQLALAQETADGQRRRVEEEARRREEAELRVDHGTSQPASGGAAIVVRHTAGDVTARFVTIQVRATGAGHANVLEGGTSTAQSIELRPGDHWAVPLARDAGDAFPIDLELAWDDRDRHSTRHRVEGLGRTVLDH